MTPAGGTKTTRQPESRLSFDSEFENNFTPFRYLTSDSLAVFQSGSNQYRIVVQCSA